MWIKPGHNPESPPSPPVESGVRLATFPRGPGVEMRVNLSHFEGRPYVALRVFEQGRDGGWWPVKGKGCSVRLSEAGALAEALSAVAGEGPPSGRPTRHGGAGRADGRSVEGTTATAPRRPGGPATALADEGPRFVEKRRRPEPRPPWEEERKTLPGAPTMAADEFNEFEQQG